MQTVFTAFTMEVRSKNMSNRQRPEFSVLGLWMLFYLQLLYYAFPTDATNYLQPIKTEN
jgi:hypothetical protein